MTCLLLATRNPHKIAEVRAILGTSVICKSLQDYPGAPEVIEDAKTFAGNATKKAVSLATWLASIADTEHGARSASPRHVLADDSGLEVDALNGAPGVYSARFAGLDTGQAGNSSDVDNNAKLLRLLEDVPGEKRTARFRCVLAMTPVHELPARSSSPVCYADELELATELFEGRCDGRIGFAPKGHAGFGYDPLFTPEGQELTFAELGEEIKNKLSHRAKALAKLKTQLGQNANIPGLTF
jgi:XTP/dITP diphosphohydrolase